MRSVTRNVTRMILGLIVLSVGLISLSVAVQFQSGKAKLTQDSDPPTPIQEDLMGDKQKKHSKIYKGTSWYTKGKKIKDLISDKGDLNISAPLLDFIKRPTPPFNEFLRQQTCGADAVVLGVVNNKNSQLIEDGTFIFTDYDISVREVLKDNQAAPVRQGDEITVTRLGGAIKLNGHIVRATDPSMGPLRVGETYLLYLKFLPDTGAYRPVARSVAEDTFHIKGEKISQVSLKLWPFGERAAGDAAPFLTEAHNALNSQCKN